MRSTRIAWLAAALHVGWAAPALAASAVAINPQTNQYAWHVSGTVDEAERKAQAACRTTSGGACLVFTACGLPGPAAIAFNSATGIWGAACGGPDQGAVDEQAVETCAVRSRGSGQCTVVERFADGEPGAGIAQGYFAGRWAEDCDADAWYRFQTINPNAFGLRACTPEGCEARDEVFRSLIGESVFIWPTDQTRLVKRGPDMLEMTRVDTSFLHRCEG
jgi:hypothetical protein